MQGIFNSICMKGILNRNCLNGYFKSMYMAKCCGNLWQDNFIAANGCGMLYFTYYEELYYS